MEPCKAPKQRAYVILGTKWASLGLYLLYGEEGGLALPDVSDAQLEASPPAPRTHHPIDGEGGGEVVESYLVESHISLLSVSVSHDVCYFRGFFPLCFFLL